MSDRCACGATLGTNSQPGLPGTDTAAKCIRCITRDRIKHILTLLPDEDEYEFAAFTDFEQQFVPSVKRQFETRGTLSERQVEILEQIYERRR